LHCRRTCRSSKWAHQRKVGLVVTAQNSRSLVNTASLLRGICATSMGNFCPTPLAET
jgi:hypothetical protein